MVFNRWMNGVEGRKLGRRTEVGSKDELNTGSYGDQEKRREV
jgi:hypothetical protein